MPIVDDFKANLEAAKKMRLAGWPLVCWLLACALIVWPLNHSGRLDLALPILNCTAVVAFLVALKWSLRRFMWFWMTIFLIVALHVMLILFIPWTTKWVPALAIAAIDSVDLIVILGIVSVVGNFREGARTSE